MRNAGAVTVAIAHPAGLPIYAPFNELIDAPWKECQLSPFILTPARRGAVVPPTWVSPAIVLMSAALLGVLNLLLSMPSGLLLREHPVWVNPPGDISQMVLGAEALLNSAWTFPLTLTPRLISASGEAVPVIITDSAPWLLLLQKASADALAWLSAPGFVLLVAFAMQPVGFVCLLRALGARRPEVLLAGAFLALLVPAWLWRTTVHVALSSHWIVLLGLALAVATVLRGLTLSRLAGFMGVAALAIGMHAYLWVCVMAVATGGLLGEFARRPGIRTGLVSIGAILCVVGASVGAAILLGYPRSVGSAGGFGFFSMNMLSPIWPQLSGIAALGGLPTPIVDATGGQYEGFNYFGAGLLAILAIAFGTFILGSWRWPDTLRAGLPLASALLLLALLSIGNQVYSGHTRVLGITLPESVDLLLGQIRASGRLFWPASYMLAAIAIMAVGESRNRAASSVMLAAATGLQWVDVSPVRQQFSLLYGASAHYAFDPAPWRSMDLSDSVLEIMPPGACASNSATQIAMMQVALLTFRQGATVKNAPMARALGGECGTLRQQVGSSLLEPPEPPPSHLRIIFTGDLPVAWLHSPVMREGCRSFELGLVCGREELITKFPPLELPAEPTRLMAEMPVKLGAGHPATDMLMAGFSPPEPWGVWTDADRAAIVFRLPEGWSGGGRLVVEAHGFVPPGRAPQRAFVTVNGRATVDWHLGGSPTLHEVAIAADSTSSGLVTVVFSLPDAISPRDAGISRDSRRLGLGLISVMLREAD